MARWGRVVKGTAHKLTPEYTAELRLAIREELPKIPYLTRTDKATGLGELYTRLTQNPRLLLIEGPFKAHGGLRSVKANYPEVHAILIQEVNRVMAFPDKNLTVENRLKMLESEALSEAELALRELNRLNNESDKIVVELSKIQEDLDG
jgi:hypothetical protein